MDSVEKEKFKFKLPKFTKRTKLLILVVFLLGVALIFATYAWFVTFDSSEVEGYGVAISKTNNVISIFLPIFFVY